jgi:hypothetical protein
MWGILFPGDENDIPDPAYVLPDSTEHRLVRELQTLVDQPLESSSAAKQKEEVGQRLKVLQPTLSQFSVSFSSTDEDIRVSTSNQTAHIQKKLAAYVDTIGAKPSSKVEVPESGSTANHPKFPNKGANEDWFRNVEEHIHHAAIMMPTAKKYSAPSTYSSISTSLSEAKQNMTREISSPSKEDEKEEGSCAEALTPSASSKISDSVGDQGFSLSTATTKDSDRSSASQSLDHDRNISSWSEGESRDLIDPSVTVQKRRIVDRIMREFCLVYFSESKQSLPMTGGSSKTNKKDAPGSSIAVASDHTSSHNVGKGRKLATDPIDKIGQEHQEESGHDRPGKRTSFHGQGNLRLGCPFFMRSPDDDHLHGSCSGPGWSSVQRIEYVQQSLLQSRLRRD